MAFPVQGQTYEFFIHLVDINDPRFFLDDPDIQDGDFTISLNGNLFTPMAITPTVSPVNSNLVRVNLTTTEMVAKVNIVGSDLDDPPEWEEIGIFIDVPTGSVETILDIEQGDRIETRSRLTINKQGTTTPVLDKTITGSLLTPDVKIETENAP